jgi:hypothetical protein
MAQRDVALLLDTLCGLAETGGASREDGTSRAEPLLERLKALTRNASDAQPLYTSRGINCLLRFGVPLNRDCKNASLDAQRCLANALLQSDHCIDLLFSEDVNGLNRILKDAQASRRSSSSDFLLCRILFLLATKTGPSFCDRAGEDNLCILQELLSDLQIVYIRQSVSESVDAAIVTKELLKLLYSITVFAKQIADQLTNLTHEALDLLIRFDQREARDELSQHTISLLTNLDLSNALLGAFFPKLHNLLLRQLDTLLPASEEGTPPAPPIAEEKLVPLLTLLDRVAAAGHQPSRQMLREQLLVGQNERQVPLGRGTSLASRLLSATTSSGSLHARECISALLFELSDSDPKQFVDNVGYGYACGFLTAHELPAPPLEHGKVNPVTGQNTADEEAAFASLEGMTDEEKEREAERLFVLFQRLKKTGVVDVKDPIQKAVDSGRFQEM